MLKCPSIFIFIFFFNPRVIFPSKYDFEKVLHNFTLNVPSPVGVRVFYFSISKCLSTSNLNTPLKSHFKLSFTCISSNALYKYVFQNSFTFRCSKFFKQRIFLFLQIYLFRLTLNFRFPKVLSNPIFKLQSTCHFLDVLSTFIFKWSFTFRFPACFL